MPVTQCWPCRHWVLVGLALAATHYAAYEWGRGDAERTYTEERHAAELAQAERERQQQEALSRLQTQLQAATRKAQQRTRTLEAKVDASSLAPDCRLSDGGLSLWNAANDGGAAK